MIILKNCKLIKELTEGIEIDKANVFIEGKEIKRIENSECDILEKEVEIIDLQGKTLIPGLIDLHVHLDMTGGDILQENITSDSYRVLQAAKFAQDTLSAGFTTIRDMGARNYIDISLRDAINNGYIKGPRLFVSGHMITPTESGNDFFLGMYREADGPYEVRKAAREQLKAGADQIKYMGTGAIMNPGGKPNNTIYEIDELKELVSVAWRHGTYVAGHNHSPEGIKNAIITGVRTIEHGSLVDDECIKLLKNNRDSFLVPTLTVINNLTEKVGGSSAFMRSKAKAVFDNSILCLKRAYNAGMKMGFGTDQGAGSIHSENAMEFMYRQKMLDMKPIDILLQATKYSAEIIGIEKTIGTIKVGKIADLVVIDGNPLLDMRLMVDGVYMVIHNGEIVPTLGCGGQ